MAVRPGLGVVVLLLTVPAIQAAPAEGTLIVQDGLDLPRGAQLHEAALLGLFLNGTREVQDLSITAPMAVVYENHVEYACVGLAGNAVIYPTASRRATYPLTDLQATLQSTGAAEDWRGWLGIYPSTGAGLDVTSTTSLTLTPTTYTRLGNSDFAETDPTPSRAFYAREFYEPHFSATTPGTFIFHGTGAIKLDGPTLRLVARENTTTLHTGEQNPHDGVCRIIADWAYVEIHDATLNLTTSQPADLALADAAATWDGPARLRGATGELLVGKNPFTAQYTDALLDGALRADLVPTMQGKRPAALVHVTGTTRTPTNAMGLAPISRSSPFPLALLVGAAVVAAAGGAALYARARARQPPPEDGLAEEERVGLTTFRAQFGVGEGDYWFACLLAAAGKRDQAKAFYLAALTRAPQVAHFDLEEGPLAFLRDDAEVRAAILGAQTRAGAGP